MMPLRIAVAPRQKAAALVIAALADALQIGIFPFFIEGGFSPFDVFLDFLVAFLLVIVLGFQWRLLAGLLIELLPGLALFPTWTALVLSFPSLRSETPSSPADAPQTYTVETLPRVPPQIPPTPGRRA